jgi:hypothetical protein
MLPDDITNFWVQFEEIWVHKSGGGWILLPLAVSPYEIDLLQFTNGHTTELVPPARLEYGKYTQIRIVVSSARVRIDDGIEVNDYVVTIPSGNLKTDKNFIFDVQSPAAVDIVVDFDLSMSLKEDNTTTPSTYQCKPVLHLVKTLEAAAIYGEISDASFLNNGNTAYVTVFIGDPASEEEYTKIEVIQETRGDNERFDIFWLVPGLEYCVEIDFDPSSPGVYYSECIQVAVGEEVPLKGGNPI